MLVLIESPYKGDDWSQTVENVIYAKRAVRDCLKRGEYPYASHLFFTQEGVLDDKNPDERKLGIEAGLAWGAKAEKTVVYKDRGITPGMTQGIQRAIAEGRTIEYREIGATL